MLILTEGTINYLEDLGKRKFKYITRDESGELWAHKTKPTRNNEYKLWNIEDLDKCQLIAEPRPSFFQDLDFSFIKWEDEPYLIDEILKGKN